jgi:hypothetical protein
MGMVSSNIQLQISKGLDLRLEPSLVVFDICNLDLMQGGRDE